MAAPRRSVQRHRSFRVCGASWATLIAGGGRPRPSSHQPHPAPPPRHRHRGWHALRLSQRWRVAGQTPRVDATRMRWVMSEWATPQQVRTRLRFGVATAPSLPPSQRSPSSPQHLPSCPRHPCRHLHANERTMCGQRSDHGDAAAKNYGHGTNRETAFVAGTQGGAHSRFRQLPSSAWFAAPTLDGPPPQLHPSGGWLLSRKGAVEQ